MSFSAIRDQSLSTVLYTPNAKTEMGRMFYGLLFTPFCTL